MPDQPDARLTLSPTQQELFKALADKRADIAVSYHAAVAIINDDVLPDRLALAAHALRELMEKLPNDGAAIDTGADLNTKVNALKKPWDDAVAEGGAHGGDTWSNGIGAALRAFLSAAGEFFKGRDAIVTGRRQQAVEFLNRLDVAAVRLPEDVQRKNAYEWMRLRGYFNDVSHHRFPTADAEFQGRVTQLEAFLHARLIPRPTADFAAIDALLQED
jgi:hypothetical protein